MAGANGGGKTGSPKAGGARSIGFVSVAQPTGGYKMKSVHAIASHGDVFAHRSLGAGNKSRDTEYTISHGPTGSRIMGGIKRRADAASVAKSLGTTHSATLRSAVAGDKKAGVEMRKIIDRHRPIRGRFL